MATEVGQREDLLVLQLRLLSLFVPLRHSTITRDITCVQTSDINVILLILLVFG